MEKKLFYGEETFFVEKKLFLMRRNPFCGEETFLSAEGTTQGDPLAMSMYALAVVPLINRLYYLADQIWYADDASASGTISQL